jgi:hypothetical protein
MRASGFVYLFLPESRNNISSYCGFFFLKLSSKRGCRIPLTRYIEGVGMNRRQKLEGKDGNLTYRNPRYQWC